MGERQSEGVRLGRGSVATDVIDIIRGREGGRHVGVNNWATG